MDLISKETRDLLSWLGGAFVTVVGGGWAVFKYVKPSRPTVANTEPGIAAADVAKIIQALTAKAEPAGSTSGGATIVRAGGHNTRRRIDNELLSRILAMVLRHRPQDASIDLDEYGWTNLNRLVSGLNAAGYSVGPVQLQQVAENSLGARGEPRFSISPDGARIRANWGHSFPAKKPVA